MSLYAYMTNLIDGVLFRASHVNSLNDAVKTAFDRVEAEYIPIASGLSADLDVNGFRVKGLPAPGADDDPMRKADMVDYSLVNHSHPGGGAVDITTLRTMVNSAIYADSMAIALDGQGRIGTTTEAVNGINRVTTITYNADDSVNTIAIAYNGKTRTETYAYINGEFSGMTAVEV